MIYESNTPVETPGLEEYLKAVTNRKLLVLACGALSLVLMLLLQGTRGSSWLAESRVLVRSTPVGATNANSLDTPVLEREREVLASIAVAQDVRDELGIDGTPSQILSNLTVSFRPDSDVLKLAYSSSSPERSRNIVNSFAENYVRQRQTAAENYYLTEIAFVTESIAAADEEIAVLTEEQQALIAEVAALAPDDPNRQSIQATINQIGSDAGGLAGTRRQLALSRSTSEQRLSTLAPAAEVLELALLPTSPSGIGDLPLQVAATVLGLIGGVAIAFLLERLDRTARDERDVELALGSAVLGSVPSFGWGNQAANSSLVMLGEGRSTKAQATREAYRRMRSTIQFLSNESGIKSFIFTSARPGEGKTTTAANLAIAIAKGGASVVLVSADMRRSNLEQLLRTSNDSGLSNWLSRPNDTKLELQLITGLDLTLLPSGPPPRNPGELLSSPQFGDLIDHLEKNYDIVLIDAPPAISTADASGASQHVGGVIVVVDSRRADSDDLLQVRSDISRTGGNLVGAVLNRDRLKRTRLLRRDTYRYERTAANQRAEAAARANVS